MSSLEENQTTIAISRRNHDVLSNLGKKGQSFDEILTEVLNKTTGYLQQNKSLRQPKIRVDRSDPLAARVSSIQTASESDSVP
ncbi:MAG: hypothetical protein M3044_15930 [Thermoproteota archaeon]|nr:hypothetical protein [Thermoproteota archaeon]